MYTQCSKCETVFRLSAQSLRAAGGQVRCGRCGEVFNALSRLAEDAQEFTRGESPLERESRANEILQSAKPVAPAAGAHVEAAPDSSALVTEPHPIRMAELLEAISPGKAVDVAMEQPEYEYPSRFAGAATLEVTSEPAAGHASEALPELASESPAGLAGEAPLELAAAAAGADSRAGPGAGAGEPAEEAVTDAMLEFTLPPTELDRIFIETTPSVVQLLAAERNRSDPSAAIHGVRPSGIPDVQSMPDVGERESDLGERESGVGERESGVGELAAAAAAAAAAEDHRGQDVASAGAPSSHALPEGRPREARPREVSSGATSLRDRAAPEPHAPRSAQSAGAPTAARRIRNAEPTAPPMPELGALRRRLSYPAWASAAVVFALLLAAQVITTHMNWISPRLSPAGPATAAGPKLSAYQLQQWGVTGDPGATGALHVRATIVNAAAQPAPYPLLRVTLADRFGTRIGRREFEPSEYLGKAPAGMLAGGDRVEAALDLQDPGKEAEAFEIDICLRGAGKLLTCAGESAEAGAATQGK